VEAEAKLTGLMRSGVSRIVNLMEEAERNHDGQPFVDYVAPLQKLAENAGRTISFLRFSIVDCTIPSPAFMREILDFIDASLSQNEIVYVHCWGGRGRTGSVIGCHFQRHGLVPREAVLDHLSALTEHQKQSFWPTPETPAQRQFVLNWNLGE